MTTRKKKTKQVRCGNVYIGGGAPVSIQSMTNTDPHDPDKISEQIKKLKEAGCDIVRLAVPDMEAAEVFGKVKKQAGIPLDIPMVADIHFDYRLAIAAMENGADKIRINPGNIGGYEKTKAVADEAKSRGIPIRVGVNSGSLEKDILEKYGCVTAEGLVESALRNIEMLEDMGFFDMVISIKSSDVVMNTQAYRLISEQTDYPLHIGVTEAGSIQTGIIKSAVGLGALLMDGIGDTMRVSLTGDPVKEIGAAARILSAAGVRKEGIQIVSCPTCGRTGVDLVSIVTQVEEAMIPISAKRSEDGKRPLTVAVMGCEVNGPGEAKGADFGVACGKGKGMIFEKGQTVKTVDEKDIVTVLTEMAERI